MVWWRAYNRLVDIAPLRTSMASSAILWSAGDLTAQHIESRVARPPDATPYNWRRTAVQVRAWLVHHGVCVHGGCMQGVCMVRAPWLVHGVADGLRESAVGARGSLLVCAAGAAGAVDGHARHATPRRPQAGRRDGLAAPSLTRCLLWWRSALKAPSLGGATAHYPDLLELAIQEAPGCVAHSRRAAEPLRAQREAAVWP